MATHARARPPPLRAARPRPTRDPRRRPRRRRRLPQPRRRLRLGPRARPALAREPARRRAARVRGDRRRRPRHDAARAALCDWLASATPARRRPAVRAAGDATPPASRRSGPARTRATSSLQITAYVAAAAHRVAEHDPAVAEHPWLAQATRYCLDAIDALTSRRSRSRWTRRCSSPTPSATTAPARPARAARPLRPATTAASRVTGGSRDEAMRPLDLAPRPDGPARALIDDDAVAARPRAPGRRAAGRRRLGRRLRELLAAGASSSGAATRPSGRSRSCARNGAC